jgi:hypothetical protein
MKNSLSRLLRSKVNPPKPPKDRLPRFDLNVPITFQTEEGTAIGHCVNVSASGMLVAFEEAAELFIVGELSLLVGDFYVSIRARVARTNGKDAGLAFLIRTENDRLASRILAEYAASRLQPEEAGKIGGT